MMISINPDLTFYQAFPLWWSNCPSKSQRSHVNSAPF